ncbi:hypothetical protein MMPV_008430 [Pyropia vietnamensis]
MDSTLQGRSSAGRVPSSRTHPAPQAARPVSRTNAEAVHLRLRDVAAQMKLVRDEVSFAHWLDQLESTIRDRRVVRDSGADPDGELAHRLELLHQQRNSLMSGQAMTARKVGALAAREAECLRAQSAVNARADDLNARLEAVERLQMEATDRLRSLDEQEEALGVRRAAVERETAEWERTRSGLVARADHYRSLHSEAETENEKLRAQIAALRAEADAQAARQESAAGAARASAAAAAAAAAAASAARAKGGGGGGGGSPHGAPTYSGAPVTGGTYGGPPTYGGSQPYSGPLTYSSAPGYSTSAAYSGPPAYSTAAYVPAPVPAVPVPSTASHDAQPTYTGFAAPSDRSGGVRGGSGGGGVPPQSSAYHRSPPTGVSYDATAGYPPPPPPANDAYRRAAGGPAYEPPGGHMEHPPDYGRPYGAVSPPRSVPPPPTTAAVPRGTDGGDGGYYEGDVRGGSSGGGPTADGAPRGNADMAAGGAFRGRLPSTAYGVPQPAPSIPSRPAADGYHQAAAAAPAAPVGLAPRSHGLYVPSGVPPGPPPASSAPLPPTTAGPSAVPYSGRERPSTHGDSVGREPPPLPHAYARDGRGGYAGYGDGRDRGDGSGGGDGGGGSGSGGGGGGGEQLGRGDEDGRGGGGVHGLSRRLDGVALSGGSSGKDDGGGHEADRRPLSNRRSRAGP